MRSRAATRAVGHPGSVDDHLRLEVDELTEMFHTEPSFSALRAWLEARGIDLTTARLAGMIDNADGVVPDADGQSIGVVVIPPGRAFEFEGDISVPGDQVFRWEELTPAEAAKTWPGVAAAIDSM